jgi:ankyrin repeat protein
MSDNFSRSLSDRPSLEHLRKQANTLLKELRDKDESTVALVEHHERQLDTETFSLQDAQRVLARSYDFPSWTRLKERVAIIAIKNGDAANLAQVLSSSSDIQKLLVTKIADERPTNHAIGKGATLLQFASFRDWQGEDVSPLLVEQGAEIDLHSASGLGKTNRIEEILAADANALSTQVDTYYPLQYAITANRPEAIRCLMQQGDDPNRDLKKVAYFGWEDDAVNQDYSPWKPIHMASLWGFDAKRVPVARALLEAGADINAVSPLDGFRPIHLVAMPNRVDMIKFYVESGVDVDSRSEKCEIIRLGSEDAGPCRDEFAMTPLMIACGEGFTEATECLLELGADVNARNDHGQTALHLAARRFWSGQPYDKVIEVLLAHGADKNAEDDSGNTPSLQ